MSVDISGRIVVADRADRPDSGLSKLFEAAGYRVFKAITANQAVRWAEAEEPDLVVVQLSSSRFFPMEIIGALKGCGRTRSVPIALAGPIENQEDDVVTCLDIGADYYLGLPDNGSVFLASVKSVVRAKAQMNELKRLSITDELTGAYNRRFFLRRLDEEVARAERHGISLVCIMIDVDRFKEVNDAHGHQAGDDVLKTLAGIFEENIRKSDVLSRYGGDEFTILLSHNTIRGAGILAEYLRKSVESRTFDGTGVPLKLTISVGLSSYQDQNTTQSAHDLIKHADIALYDAKNRGRNMVRVFGDSSLSHAAGRFECDLAV